MPPIVGSGLVHTPTRVTSVGWPGLADRSLVRPLGGLSGRRSLGRSGVGSGGIARGMIRGTTGGRSRGVLLSRVLLGRILLGGGLSALLAGRSRGGRNILRGGVLCTTVLGAGVSRAVAERHPGQRGPARSVHHRSGRRC